MSAKQQQTICGFPGSIHPSATLYPYTLILYVAMHFYFCAKNVNFSLNHLCPGGKFEINTVHKVFAVGRK